MTYGDYGEYDRQREEVLQRMAQNREQRLNEAERRWGVNRDLAEYLLILEDRIARLEQDR